MFIFSILYSLLRSFKESSIRPFVILFFLHVVSCTTSEKALPSYIHAKYPGDEKIDSLISLMTLEEKVRLIHAESSFATGSIPRLNIPSWVMTDGPHGIRKEHGIDYIPDEGVDDSCTYLPVGVALSSTWNPDLAYEYGMVLGNEAKYRGKDVILGPGVNIIRTPLNGRNFEYFSEDPFLTSRLAVPYIKGIQDQGVSACVKHFIANNQETNRSTVNVEMSDRALYEIYLPAFQAAVQQGNVNTVMGSYNKFRGQYCTHNAYLMNTLLKEQWKFQGVVMSDWGSVHSTREAIYNGTDVEMGTDIFMQPEPEYGKFFLGNEVIKLVSSCDANESLVDDKVRRILRVMYKTKLAKGRNAGAINTPRHQAIALTVAEEGIVLLKNQDILPLRKNELKSIAVIGANASRKHAASGGSSQVNAKYELTVLDGLRELAGDKVEINIAAGYKIEKEGKPNADLINEAVRLASTSDVVIYVGGWIHGYSDAWEDNAFDSETVDKPNMNLPFGQEELIRAIQKVNHNTIIVLYGGGPTDMSAWSDQSKAIMQAWYPGMEGGRAIAKIIFGETNPSGKLPMTFPVKLEDSPAHALGEYPGNDVVHYKEGLLVGYRYFDTKKIQPLYPFGYGLSYTNFAFDKFKVEKHDHKVKVSLEVRNTGTVAGAEVIQVYVRDEAATVERPDKELKAFKKIFLEPNESKAVELVLDESAFKYYDDSRKEWVLEPGRFLILTGNSSKNVKLTGEVIF
jgi:beta-glucosidase